MIIKGETIVVKYRLKVVNIVDETPDTKTYYFEKPEDFIWEAGSHTHIAHIGYDDGEKPNKNWVRHLSIMTLPREGSVGITTRMKGELSEFKVKLAQLRIGDEVVLFKLGNRMGLRREDRPVILLSMGVGIATMRPVILDYKHDKSHIPSLTNVTIDASGSFLFRRELDLLSDETYDNRWCSSRQSFYETIQELSVLKDAIYYVIGSDKFIRDIISRLRLQDVKDEDIIIDKKAEVLPEFFTGS